MEFTSLPCVRLTISFSSEMIDSSTTNHLPPTTNHLRPTFSESEKKMHAPTRKRKYRLDLPSILLWPSERVIAGENLGDIIKEYSTEWSIQRMTDWQLIQWVNKFPILKPYVNISEVIHGRYKLETLLSDMASDYKDSATDIPVTALLDELYRYRYRLDDTSTTVTGRHLRSIRRDQIYHENQQYQQRIDDIYTSLLRLYQTKKTIFVKINFKKYGVSPLQLLENEDWLISVPIRQVLRLGNDTSFDHLPLQHSHSYSVDRRMQPIRGTVCSGHQCDASTRVHQNTVWITVEMDRDRLSDPKLKWWWDRMHNGDGGCCQGKHQYKNMGSDAHLRCWWIQNPDSWLVSPHARLDDYRLVRKKQAPSDTNEHDEYQRDPPITPMTTDPLASLPPSCDGARPISSPTSCLIRKSLSSNLRDDRIKFGFLESYPIVKDAEKMIYGEILWKQTLRYYEFQSHFFEWLANPLWMLIADYEIDTDPHDHMHRYGSFWTLKATK